MEETKVPPPPGVEIVDRKAVFQGYFRVDKYLLRHKLFGGGMSAEIGREIFERGHAAGVLPYDPVRDEVLLIEQFRPGALAAGWHPWVIEPVAGIIEPGEDLTDVIHREAHEEANVVIQDIIPIYHYLTTPGGSSETCALYCGRVNAEGAGGIHGLDGENEDIRVMVMPFAEVASWVNGGGLNNALLIIALQWLVLNHDKVRAQWR